MGDLKVVETGLVPIYVNHEDRVVANARELWEFLDSKQEFANWIKNRLEKYGFVEGEDYFSFDKIIKRESGATTRTEYLLTIDVAKEIAMVENNDKGRQVRKYFIECEKRLKGPKALTPEYALELAQNWIAERDARMLVEKDKEVLEVALNVALEWRTVMQYNQEHNMGWNMETCKAIGRTLSSVCRGMGFEIRKCKTNDERFKEVNSYHKDAWRVFEEHMELCNGLQDS